MEVLKRVEFMVAPAASTSAHEGVLLAIPCYRDVARLEPFLESLCKALRSHPEIPVWIRVVDDGSPPDEQEALDGLILDMSRRGSPSMDLVKLPRNVGKGGAIRRAWGEGARSRWLAFVDADGAVPAWEVVRLLRIAIEAPNEEALFASRIRMLGHDVERSFSRHLMGRIYCTFASVILGLRFYDSQCGMKIIPARAYRKICPFLVSSGFSMDMELIAALAWAGVSMREIPIDWMDVPGSKVRLIRDSLRMFIDLLTLRRRRLSWTSLNLDS